MTTKGPSRPSSGSPTKRRRLGQQPSSSASSSSRIPPTSSGASSSTTINSGAALGDEDYHSARLASSHRVLSIWSRLEERYSRPMDEDDIIDLRHGRLLQDRGVLKRREQPWHYGKLLKEANGEDKDDDGGTTTDGGELEGRDDDTDADGLSTRPGSDAEDHETLEEEDILQLQDPVEALDELDEWDTVPAPNSPPPESSAPSRAESIIPKPSPSIRSFLSNIRPRLEKLAREREESPLPMQDLEAFLSSESTLQAAPGYVEPEGSDGEDIGGFTDRSGSSEEESEEAEGAVLGDRSQDPLDEWDTVPAPIQDEDEDEATAAFDVEFSPHQDDTTVDEPLLAIDPASSEDEDDEVPLSGNVSKGRSQPPLLTPPYSNRSASTNKIPSPDKLPSPTKPSKSKLSASEARNQPSDRSPRKPSTSRTPSRHLIPEVVIPYYPRASASPSKSARTKSPPPRLKSPPPPIPRKNSSSSKGKKRKRVDPDEMNVDASERRQPEVERQEFVERMGSLGLYDDNRGAPVEHDRQQEVDIWQNRGSPIAQSSRMGGSDQLDSQWEANAQDEQFWDYQTYAPLASAPAPDPYAQQFIQPPIPLPPLMHPSSMGPPPPPSPAAYQSRPPPPSPAGYSFPQQLPPPASAPGSSHEALLTQVLYSLNYLAYQNATMNHNQIQNQHPGHAQQQQARAPIPPSPDVGYRMGSTPVTSRRFGQAQASLPPLSTSSSTPSFDADGFAVPPTPTRGRSILRVGGDRERAQTTGPFGGSDGLALGFGNSPESDRRDRWNLDSPRRSASVTFSDPPSVMTPKGHYAPTASPAPSSPASSLTSFALQHMKNASASRPSPLRKGSSSSYFEDRGRGSGSDSPSNSDAVNSQAVLAKARAALHSSVATTSSLGMGAPTNSRARWKGSR